MVRSMAFFALSRLLLHMMTPWLSRASSSCLIVGSSTPSNLIQDLAHTRSNNLDWWLRESGCHSVYAPRCGLLVSNRRGRIRITTTTHYLLQWGSSLPVVRSIWRHPNDRTWRCSCQTELLEAEDKQQRVLATNLNPVAIDGTHLSHNKHWSSMDNVMLFAMMRANVSTIRSADNCWLAFNPAGPHDQLVGNQPPQGWSKQWPKGAPVLCSTRCCLLAVFAWTTKTTLPTAPNRLLHRHFILEHHIQAIKQVCTFICRAGLPIGDTMMNAKVRERKRENDGTLAGTKAHSNNPILNNRTLEVECMVDGQKAELAANVIAQTCLPNATARATNICSLLE